MFTLPEPSASHSLSHNKQIDLRAWPNDPPSVDAGEPVAVREGVQLTLNATASDPDGDQLTYSWSHDSTLDISLTNADSLSPTFTAPQVSANTTVAFTLTADDGHRYPLGCRGCHHLGRPRRRHDKRRIRPEYNSDTKS